MRHPISKSKLALIVTGARWQCAHIQQFAGACVTYANGTTEIKYDHRYKSGVGRTSAGAVLILNTQAKARLRHYGQI
ncbi:hypothetical protein BZG09_13250 [Salinivibrio kushneri]|uniref:Uncharacterized protein n=1 Tax=Salinivibrio kushneri TaxID=1908198 RepID=A0AB36K2S7_9GAMM|nr:hypothetical protein BZG09_13250 [Salinivibrio kushneri]